MRILVISLIAFLLAFPAMAAPAIDKAGAEALKPRIEAGLKKMIDNLKAGGIVVESSGDLTIEPVDNYYAITTPSYAIGLPKGVRRTIGMIAINAIPTDDPDILKAAIAIPTPISDTDAAGNVIGRIEIGKQSMNGLWHLSGLIFTQLAADYTDVVATRAGSRTSIPRLTSRLLLTKDAGGLWSGPTETKAENITHEGEKVGVKIGSVLIKSAFEGLDMNAVAKPRADSKKPATVGSYLADSLTHMANGTRSAVTVENIGISKTGDDGTKTQSAIQRISFNTNIGDMKSGLPKMDWQGGMEGFSTESETMRKFLPSLVRFKGASSGLPLAELLKAKDKQEQSAIIAKTGGLFKLDEFVIDAPAYGISSMGKMGMTPDGKQSGSMNITLRGLTDLSTWANAQMAGQDAKKLPPFVPAIMAGLGFVQMLGKPATDAQGRAIHVYDFQATPDGKLTLNGQDLSLMMGALGGSKKAESAPNPPATPR